MTTRKRVQAERPAEKEEPLHIKHRPKTLDDMFGQAAVVSALDVLTRASNAPHCYLFIGPAGTGKTTLARILADKFDCGEIIEIDAATHTGIDAMREVTASLRYRGIGDKPGKMVVVDECQKLSAATWDSLLKITEDAPSHVYFAFCTTDPKKVPATNASRMAAFTLKPFSFDDLMDLLESVVTSEKLTTPTNVVQVAASEASGSARKALVNLAMVAGCRTPAEANDVLASADEDQKDVIDLCKELVRGNLTWPKVQASLKALKETPAESIRIVITNYLAGCVMNAKTDKEAVRLLNMLEAFSTPCNSTDKLAPIIIALGKFVFP
jgi:DNA polymerase-3 subunit gamma/tau